MADMLKRERVLSAVKRKPVDKVPCSFRAEQSTLKRIYHHVGHEDFDRLLDDLNVDIRFIDSIAPPETNMGAYYQNYWGERYTYRDSEWGQRREDIPGALENAKTMQDFKNFDWPSIDIFDYSPLPSLCEKYGSCALIYGFGDVFTRAGNVRGFENFMFDIADNPEFIDYMIKQFADFYIDDYTHAQKICDGRIDIYLIMGDLASQLSPLLSPDTFIELVGPHLSRLCARIHELGAYAFYHSCGAASPFYDGLIKCGVDIIDPIQRATNDMNPENLKKNFGSRVCFHGGIDVQTTLPNGTTDDVRAEVRRYLSVFDKSGGGYICCPSHYVQEDTPPENILALYDEIIR